MRTYKDLKAAKQRAQQFISNGGREEKPSLKLTTMGGPQSGQTRNRISMAHRKVSVTLPKFSWDEA